MKRAGLSLFLLFIFVLDSSCFSLFPQRKGAANTQDKDASQKDNTIDSKNGKCYYNDVSYNYGEKIKVEDSCLSCICNNEFNQRDISACVTKECPHDHFKHLYSSCVPLYDKDQCCPIRWDCGKGLTKLDSQCKCNLKYLRHYEAKNCTPVYEIKDCPCPTRFICPPEKELDPTVCRYEGKIYQIGTEIDTGTPCERCRCHRHAGQERASFDCLNIECPASLTSPLEEGCYRSHNLSYCCSVDTICPAKNEKVTQCEYNGQLYNLGQKIYPEEEPCLTCLCTKDWSGVYSDNCIRNKCFMGQYGNLERGCIPIYHEETCCHVEFHCPERRDQEKAIQRASLDKGIPERCVLPSEKGPCYANFEHYYFNILKRQCEPFRYGGCLGNQNNFLTLEECQSTCETKLRTAYTNLDHMCYFDGHYYTIGEEYGINHPTGCVTCTCKVPPDLTCVYKACPSPPHEYSNCKGVYTPGVCCPEYNCTNKDGEIVTWSSNFMETETCVTPQCPSGCDLVENSPPGVCPGCRCQSVTVEISVAENCTEVTCSSPLCVKYKSANGCLGCVCQLMSREMTSASNWNITAKQFGVQAGSSSEKSVFQMGSSSIQSGFQEESSSKQSGFQVDSSSKQSGFQSTSFSKQSGFQSKTLSKQASFQSRFSSEQSGYQVESSSKESGSQMGYSTKGLSVQEEASSKGLSVQEEASSKGRSVQEEASSKGLSVQEEASSKGLTVQKEASSKGLTVQKEASSKGLSVQEEASSKGLSVQEETSSKGLTVQKEASSKGLTVQKEASSKRLSVQEETSSKGLSVQEEASSKGLSVQKGASSKGLDVQKGTSSKGHNVKEQTSSKRPEFQGGLLPQPYGLQMEYQTGKSDSQSELISSETDGPQKESSAKTGKKCTPVKCEYSCQ